MRETPKAAQAWNDYLAMGAERSLDKLFAHYQTATKAAPVKRLRTLKDWSSRHDWQARLVAIAEQERAAIIKRGVAERQNRVDAYNDIWDRLRGVINSREREHPQSDYAAAGVDSGLMVLTVKFLPNGTRVEEWAVDTGLLKELREYGKQVAVELGEWSEKKELTGAGGKEVLIRVVYGDDEPSGTDDTSA
jgi:hypothetical protein